MGSNTSKSESNPLTGGQRAETFQAALSSLGGGQNFNNRLNSMGYHAPQYTNPTNYREAGAVQAANFTAPGKAQTLSNGDYEKLQQSMLQGNTAGLDAAWKNRSKEIDQNMADRGLWSSGVAEKAKQQDYAQNWTPAYQQAASQATQQRYAMQNQEQQGLNSLNSQNANAANQFNLGNAQMANQGNFERANAYNTYGSNSAQMRNAWNAEQANQGYNAQWRPVDYLAGIWNGTGGTVSSGQAGGWSI